MWARQKAWALLSPSLDKTVETLGTKRCSESQRHAASSAAVKGLQSICPNMQQLTPSLKTSPFTLTSPPTGFSGTTFCQVSPDKKIIDIFNDESGNVMWLAKISGDYWTVCVCVWGADCSPDCVVVQKYWNWCINVKILTCEVHFPVKLLTEAKQNVRRAFSATILCSHLFLNVILGTCVCMM